MPCCILQQPCPAAPLNLLNFQIDFASRCTAPSDAQQAGAPAGQMWHLGMLCWTGLTSPNSVLGLLQVEGEPPLVQAKYQPLHAQLWQRQQRALLRSQEPAQQAAAQARQQALRHLPSLKDQPAWIQQGQLYPHQLQVAFLPRKLC